jgi:hypothetical protein
MFVHSVYFFLFLLVDHKIEYERSASGCGKIHVQSKSMLLFVSYQNLGTKSSSCTRTLTSSFFINTHEDTIVIRLSQTNRST